MATLNFKGKSFVQNHHLSVPYHQLVPKKDKSLTDKVRLDDNLIIHGDNLKALKALLPTYTGRVKCIFIDPPYNTGTEKWIYNDNVNSPMMQEWLGKVVDREDLTRHDKWLCMMMPRLKILKELLKDDGAIFITIDANEVHQLMMLMDEVFGNHNFIDCLVWRKKVSPSNDATWFSSDHDFILVYARNKDIWRPNRLERTAAQLKFYTNPDDDARGVWNSTTYTCNKSKTERPNLYYPIKNPHTGKLVYPKQTAVWAFSREVHAQHVEEKRLYWGVDGKAQFPRLKKFLSEVGPVVPRSVWAYEEVGHTQEAMREFLEIFPAGGFNTPKPTRLLRRILQIATSSSGHGDIVLDSFAGSGATAHAVLGLNKEDGGTRRFILVECEDYADKITAERARRVIEGIPKAADEILQEGLGGSFSYFELGKPLELDGILTGKNLPSYTELARYVFYTATGQEFDEKKVNEKKFFIGSTKEHDVYLLYKPDVEFLKGTALTRQWADTLGSKGKRRLVFAPTKYLDQEQLAEFRIDFAQLPFEIYRIAE